MTDIVERLCDDLKKNNRNGFRITASVERDAISEINSQSATIASLRQQVRELSELLDCIKSERDQQLAESQAREKVLRDALDTLDMHFPESEHRLECERVDALVTNARNLPFDSTALDSAVKKAVDTAVKQAKLEGGKEALFYAANTEECLFYGLRPSALRRMAHDLKGLNETL